jgi:lysophospholipase L1-like esterase
MPEHLTETAATTTYPKADFPASLLAAAGGITKPWDTTRALFNRKIGNTRSLIHGLGRAFGTEGQLRIALAGDSTTAGYRADYLPSKQLETLFESAGYAIAGQIITPSKGGTGVNLDPTISTTGTWNGQVGNHLLESKAAGNTVTYTSTRPGTTLEIVTFGSLATWTLDGVAQADIPAQTGSLRKTTLTGLADTVHTVVITTTDAASFYLASVGTWRANGVIVGNFGINSSRSDHWSVTSYYGAAQVINQFAPHVITMNLGINDFAAAWTPATFKTNLDLVLTRFTGTPSLFLETSNPQQSVDFTTFETAKYELATTRDIAVIDMAVRFGTYTEAFNAGLYTYAGDVVHPTRAGQALKAAARAQAFGIL